MYPNYPYDQKPSTSAPQRQIFGAPPQMPFAYRQSPANPMVRVAGGIRNVNQWMNPYDSSGSLFSNYNRNCSPAPSELSCASGASMNSVMSGFSHLSINTQLSMCATNAYQNYSMGSVSYENQPPLDRDEIERIWDFLVKQLQRNDFFRMEKEKFDPIIEHLQILVTGSKDRKEIKELSVLKKTLPYRKLTPEQRCDFLKAMFNRVKCSRNDQEQMFRRADQQYQFWGERTNGLLKYLLLIMTVHTDLFDDDFEVIIQQHKINHEVANPLEALDLLLHSPSQKFTYFAVYAIHQLMYPFAELSRSRRVRRLRLLKPWMTDPYLEHLLNALMAIVIHDDISVKPKTMSLELTIRLMSKRLAVRKVFLAKGYYNGYNNGYVFQLIHRCFQMQSEEGLIHSTTNLFVKMTTQVTPPPGGIDENESFLNEFLNQLTESGGFQAIGTMLNHGSPRVLTGCLTFLSILGSHTEKIKADLQETVLGVLKLVCSSEPLIGQQCLRFLVNIVSNNPVLKQLVTDRKGPEMIVQVLCQDYKMSYDPSIDIAKLRNITEEINEHGPEILRKLLGKDNPRAAEAALQLIENPQTFAYITFRLSHKLDQTNLELLLVLKRMHHVAPHKTKEIMEKKNGMTLAETIAALVFAARLFDRSSTKEIVFKIIVNAMELIDEICKQKEVAAMFACWFGKTEKVCDCPINLFGETEDPSLRVQLLKFLAFLTNNNNPSCLRDLPRIWTKHPHFVSYMQCFENSPDKEVSTWAKHLLQLACV